MQPETNFEKSLADLEIIVKKMEKGDLSLEASLQSFEEGIKLAKNCQIALKQAEQTVECLIEKNGMLQTEPFSTDLPE